MCEQKSQLLLLLNLLGLLPHLRHHLRGDAPPSPPAAGDTGADAAVPVEDSAVVVVAIFLLLCLDGRD